MGLIRAIKRRRAHREYQRAVTTFFEELNQAMHDECKRQCEGLEQTRDSLAVRVERGDAVVLGVNEQGATIVAERKDALMQEVVRRQDEAWERENERIERAHRAMRAQFVADEAPVTFGRQVAGGTKPQRVSGAVASEPTIRERMGAETAKTQQEPAQGVSRPKCVECGSKAVYLWLDSRSGSRTHHCIEHAPSLASRDAEDDGAVPPQAEVDAILNAGMSDSPELVGEIVLYEADRRNGKKYAVPAIVTCVQKTHTEYLTMAAARAAGGPWVTAEDGFYVGLNPLPIPHDGTVHLRVFTPGTDAYRELSVPYDPTGQTPRSWRHRKQPF